MNTKMMMMDRHLEQSDEDVRAGKKPAPNPEYLAEQKRFAEMVASIVEDANKDGTKVQQASTSIGPAIEALDQQRSPSARQLAALEAAEVFVRKQAAEKDIDRNLIDTAFSEAKTQLKAQATKAGYAVSSSAGTTGFSFP